MEGKSTPFLPTQLLNVDRFTCYAGSPLTADVYRHYNESPTSPLDYHNPGPMAYESGQILKSLLQHFYISRVFPFSSGLSANEFIQDHDSIASSGLMICVLFVCQTDTPADTNRRQALRKAADSLLYIHPSSDPLTNTSRQRIRNIVT